MTRQCISMVAALMLALAFIIAAQAGTYTADFDQYLSDNQSKDMVSAIITIADRVDLEALKAALSASKADRQEWHEAVVRALQDKATESQANVLAKLDELQKQGVVSSYKNLWLGNLIIVTATQDALNEIVIRTDIDQIAPNYIIESEKPTINKEDEPIIASVENGLKAIRADEVWAMGYTGEGRLVSQLDTGVDGDHPALASRWRGLDSRYSDNPGWAWFDPVTNTDFPFDSGQHGTHVMGTMCGLGESTGDTIGVAYGAEWISAGVIDRVSNSQTVSDAIAALQWVVDPDEDPSTVWDVPDVCCNSWGLYSIHGYSPCDETLWEAMDYAEAAGVVVIFAAGNEGSTSETVRRPADRATTNISAFAIGAVNGNDTDFPIADFSSRGPSYCTEDSSAAIKPEISAPGVNIRSSIPGGGYEAGWNGTSMAAPHVAGVIAMMREANPDLTSDEIKQILLETAVDLGAEGNDNDYGMGIIDAYVAVQRALSLREDWGTLSGTITDQATGDPISGAAISVVDRNYSTISGSDGVYYLYMPADTLYDIKVDYSPTHLPLYDQQMVAASETTTVNYVIEGKVATTVTVSFGNPDEISYRTFYMKGSWDNDGFYDASWSGDLVAMTDDGQSPDETAGDGIFTAQVALFRDLDNTFSWSVYTENYGTNSIDDAFLANGSAFAIDDLDPVTAPTLAPNPSGSDNNFVFSVEGDNSLSFDLDPGIDGDASKWGGSANLTAGITYNFFFHVMHGDEAIYGSGGVGGTAYSYTPTANGAYDFIFDDDNDSYQIQLGGTEGAPEYLGGTNGLDGHVPVCWLAPGTAQSLELAYDDGTVFAGWYYYSSTDLIGVMFAPESYPVAIDSVMIHVLTEGDAYWPWPDATHDPIGISIYLDNGNGLPEDDPVFYTTATAELGQWVRADVGEIIVASGYFWVTMNYVDGEGYDAMSLDAACDYPANQWYRLEGTWYNGSPWSGDNMIRAKVYSDDASTWLSYDDAKPTKEIFPEMITANISDRAVCTMGAFKLEPASSNPTLPNRMVYHPLILSDPPFITDTEVIAGYNLYRGTASGPFNQNLKINSELLTGRYYDDWGVDTYGPIVNGTTYYYQATAVYNIGGSYVEVGPSNEAVCLPINLAPAAPTSLVGDVSDHTVTLTWDANTEYDIASYNIYRRDYNTDEFNLVSSIAHPTIAFSEDIAAGGIYRYKIKAMDAEGMESEVYSNYVDLSIGLIPPGDIQASTDVEFGIEVEWRAPGSSNSVSNTQDLNVAVVHSDYENSESEIMNYLIENGEVNSYTYFNANTGTPSLSDLEPYDIVIFWSNMALYDPAGMGDVLADYVDLGKGVIVLNFSFYSGVALRGRFMEEYSPLSTSYNGFTTVNLGEYDTTSPLMEGVSSLSDYYAFNVTANDNADVAAYWDSGYPLIATSTDFIDVVCINAAIGASYRQWDGDMLQLVLNAVKYASGGSSVDPDGYKVYRSDSESGSFAELAALAGDVRKYTDSPLPNDIPYYYQVTAIWDGEESDPSSVAEGIGQNHAPEVPTGLTASIADRTISLTWSFTDLMSDFDHYNVYRMIYGETVWNLIGSSTGENYADEITGEDAVYMYSVTAVDNGSPQLESQYSAAAYGAVGNLPPNNLAVSDNQDSVVPLHWYAPGILPCTTLVYDDGVVSSGQVFYDITNLLAKQFTGIAPVQICTVFVHVLTEGDESWPWPDNQHDPVVISIWDDNGSGQPGSVIAETTATCELGEWLAIAFESPVTCNTDNFWVSFTNATNNLDAIALDYTSNYVEHEWYRSDGVWYNSHIFDGDSMIRAAVTINSVTELLTEDNPVSNTVALQTSGSESDYPQLYDTEEMLGYYIYRSTSSDVPLNDDYRITPSYVTDTQYDDENVVNGTTYYYIAAAAYDNNGEVELSIASNEVSATPIAGGQLAVDPAVISVTGYTGGVVTVPITLANDGGLAVTFNVTASSNTVLSLSNTNADYAGQSKFSIVNGVYDKSDIAPEDTYPPVVTNSGGPDNFGYSWIDSDDEGGPEYSWVDISGIGEAMEFDDDTNLGPYYMQFNFPFYGSEYSTFRACSNGWLSFTHDGNDFFNCELPSTDAPYNIISPFWDDLNPANAGECYYYAGVDSTIISWIGVQVLDSELPVTFQIILLSNGTIIMQYGTLEDEGSYCTVGIQNGDGSDGLLMAYDQSYLHSDMAIKIKTQWISVDSYSGTIEPNGSSELNAILDASSLEAGTYTGTLFITASDINRTLPLIEVPVTFIVADSIIGIDDDYATLPTTYSLDQNYPNPFNAHTEIKYALPVNSDVQLEIYNVLGQKVTTLVDEEQTAGYHSLIWDGTNESGQAVSSGMYLYKLVTNEDTFVKKMVMLK